MSSRIPVVTSERPTVVRVETDGSYTIIEKGVQGPAGAAGGGEEEVPTSPHSSQQTGGNIAAGASTNLDCAAVTNGKTGKLAQITLSSSAAYKWQIIKRVSGSDTVVDIVFTSGNAGDTPTHEWEPPHRDYMTITGNGTDLFRVTATNLDAANAATPYATFYYDEV